MQLLEEMREESYAPDATSYNLTIRAYEKGGQWKDRIFEVLYKKVYGIARLYGQQRGHFRLGRLWVVETGD